MPNRNDKRATAHTAGVKMTTAASASERTLQTLIGFLLNAKWVRLQGIEPRADSVGLHSEDIKVARFG
jgi:hypothetical protein